MGELQWYFPRSLEEVPGILARDGVAPHGGGTGLLRAGLGQLAGLMDLGRLGLDRARLEPDPARPSGGSLVLGATLSYAAACRQVAALLGDPDHILVQALSRAATTPLRNRITLGGSLAAAPYWSDLLGPLIALEAVVRQIGAQAGSWPVEEHVQDRAVRRGSLITEIALPALRFRGNYHRHCRTAGDRPMFTITVLRRAGSPRVEDPRIVLSGSTGRFQRLRSLEARLAGRAAIDAAALQELLKQLEQEKPGDLPLSMPARMGFSAEYLQAAVRVELERALRANLMGEEK